MLEVSGARYLSTFNLTIFTLRLILKILKKKFSFTSRLLFTNLLSQFPTDRCRLSISLFVFGESVKWRLHITIIKLICNDNNLQTSEHLNEIYPIVQIACKCVSVTTIPVLVYMCEHLPTARDQIQKRFINNITAYSRQETRFKIKQLN